jgi:hypothetical protein
MIPNKKAAPMVTGATLKVIAETIGRVSTCSLVVKFNPHLGGSHDR